MTDDRRPTTDLRANSHILGKFQMTITLQRVNRYPSCLVLGGVFGDGGSNGAISGWIKFKMGAGGHLGKLQTAISQQCIIRFTVCMYANHTLPSVSQSIMIEIRNLFHEGGSPADLRCKEEERKRPSEIAEKTVHEECTLDWSQSKVFLVLNTKAVPLKN